MLLTKNKMPMLLLGAIFVLCFSSVSLGSGVMALYQDPDQKQDFQQRWNKLSPEEKKELLNKYKKYKDMPEAEKKVLKNRHKKLKEIRDSIQTKVKVNDPRARKAALDRKVKEHLKGKARELWKHFDFKGTENSNRMVQKIRKRIQELNHKNIDSFLKDLVKQGELSLEEGNKILKLSPHKKRQKVFYLLKKHLLKTMEGLLSDEEMKELKNLDPFKFHNRMRGKKKQWGMLPPARGLTELTEDQEKRLKKMKDAQEKQKTREGFFKANLKARLVKAGVDPEKVDKILKMSHRDRQAAIMNLLRKFKKEGKAPFFKRQRSNPKEKRGRPKHRPPRRGGSRKDRRPL